MLSNCIYVRYIKINHKATKQRHAFGTVPLAQRAKPLNCLNGQTHIFTIEGVMCLYFLGPDQGSTRCKMFGGPASDVRI